jgi:hypothetical protein
MEMMQLEAMFVRVKRKEIVDFINKYRPVFERVAPENSQYAIDHHHSNFSDSISTKRKAEPNRFVDKFYTDYFLKHVKLGFTYEESLQKARNEADVKYKEASKGFTNGGFYLVVNKFINQPDDYIIEQMAKFAAEEEFLVNFKDYFKSDSPNQLSQVKIEFEEVIEKLRLDNVINEQSSKELITFYSTNRHIGQKSNWQEVIWLLYLLILTFKKAGFLDLPENIPVGLYISKQFKINLEDKDANLITTSFRNASKQAPYKGILKFSNRYFEEKFDLIIGVYNQFGFDLKLL